MKKNSILIISFLILSACATSRPNIRDIQTKESADRERTEVIRATGMTPLVNNDLVEAKKRALAEAQKSAVEMTVGVYVNAATRVEKAIMVDQQILSKTNGYIKKYKILSEGREGEFYKLTIEALVKIEDINKDLSILGLNAPPSPTTSALRIALSIQDMVDGNADVRLTSENILTEKLLNFQYKVIDANEFAIAARNLQTVDLYNSADQQKKIGNSLNADVLILGKATSSFNTNQGFGGLISYRAALSFRVLKVKESALLYANSVSSGGVSATRADAAQEALKRTAELAAAELLKVLEQRLKAFNYLTITIRNVADLNQLSDIIKKLQAMIEVKYAQTDSFHTGMAVIKIGTDPSLAHTIAKKLESTPKDASERAPLRITTVGTDFIEGEIVQQ